MRDSNKPKALVVGPMKAGTSWIHDYLYARGDVALPAYVKETFYFDRYFDRSLNWYESLFEDSVGDVCVEVAPSLFHRSNDVPERIFRDLGDIPIVVTLRDPVARSWSHYQHMRRGYTRKSVREAVVEYPEIIDASRYDFHLQNWRSTFSRVTVLNQEDLISDPQKFANYLSDGLEIGRSDYPASKVKVSNAATVPSSFFLAKLGRELSHGLRRRGFYKIVDFARQLGLKRVFFGGKSRRKKSVNPADYDFLKRQIFQYGEGELDEVSSN